MSYPVVTPSEYTLPVFTSFAASTTPAGDRLFAAPIVSLLPYFDGYQASSASDAAANTVTAAPKISLRTFEISPPFVRAQHAFKAGRLHPLSTARSIRATVWKRWRTPKRQRTAECRVAILDRDMRILLVSDLHYSLPQLDWVVRATPSFDLVVMAGDHLDIGSAVPLDAQSVVILRYLALLKHAGNVVVSSGNHDLTGPDASGEQAAVWLAEARAAGIPTDGDSLLFGETLVTICPWWDGPIGRAALDAGSRPMQRDGPRAGSGSTTGRRWGRRRAGPVGVITAMPMSRSGSISTSPTSC